MGIAAALFFAVTFIVNRLMSLSGSNWIWSSSLRFFWMLPILFIIVWLKGGLRILFRELSYNSWHWFVWSTVGFGFFYAPLTFAAAYSPSWLLASTWQITIIAGMIIAPLISHTPSGKRQNTLRSAFFSGIIILGIIIMQIGQARTLPLQELLKCIIPVTIAAFAYPIGNRKMMVISNGKLDVFQRVLGMVISSMPFWMVLSAYEFFSNHTVPGKAQLLQTFIVAIFSGILATALFFAATDKVRTNESRLAAVEATQATEVIFAVIGEIFIMGANLPDLYGALGIFLVMIGMILHSLKG